MKLLLELRPALDGHAGIPQENRLLFNGLCQLDDFEVLGMLQSGSRVLAAGLPLVRGEVDPSTSPDRRIDSMSRVVVSLQPPVKLERIRNVRTSLRSVTAPFRLLLATLLGRRQTLTGFDSTRFSDFVWRAVFAKTLPPCDRAHVLRAPMRVVREPYTAMHLCGLMTRRFGRAIYPRLETTGIDVLIAQTPYPAALSRSTRLVVRYMDAIPLLMPHTIIRKAFHQAQHYNSLRENIRRGAWFACASDATRADLISIFPEVAPRAVTIHCMVSHHYFADESSPSVVQGIVTKRGQRRDRARLPPAAGFDSGQVLPAGVAYLLMVSTLEPRKNHATLVAAWEQLRASRYPELKLVIVGGLGWEHESIVARFQPWLDSGDAFLLHDVPADELRALYRHARTTVCPSYGEGFDYAGIESMRCGGVVAASDLPVHREVYDDAAEYFDPYSVEDTAAAIDRLIDPARDERRASLVAAGDRVSQRYLPERILPQWREFLLRIAPGGYGR